MGSDRYLPFLPLILNWIQQTLDAHAHEKRAVSSFKFPRLPHYFSEGLLNTASVVPSDRLPVPPLSALGLREFADFEGQPARGITYRDTYFLWRADATDESLHFHELVHVVQWADSWPQGFPAAVRRWSSRIWIPGLLARSDGLRTSAQIRRWRSAVLGGGGSVGRDLGAEAYGLNWLEHLDPPRFTVVARICGPAPEGGVARTATGSFRTSKPALPSRCLTKTSRQPAGVLRFVTMHLARGLEFRAVVLMACDDEIIPLQERIETVTDDADLEEVYNMERHLLYVDCTRAQDHLLVTSGGPPSESLDDLRNLGWQAGPRNPFLLLL